MLPWRNMICDDCKARGFPASVYEFYSHFWGMGHDHKCAPLTERELKAIIKDALIEHDKNETEASNTAKTS